MKIKVDKVVAAKIVGTVLTIGGMLVSNWTGKKEQDKTLEKLVNEKLKSNMGES